LDRVTGGGSGASRDCLDVEHMSVPTGNKLGKHPLPPKDSFLTAQTGKGEWDFWGREGELKVLKDVKTGRLFIAEHLGDNVYAIRGTA
jgi:hypothetical protein